MTARTKLLAGGALAKMLLTPLERPDRLPRSLRAMRPWGSSVAGLVAGAAARYPDRVGVVDDDGATTYWELWRRS
jgi:non-ribosomal peptide synthetase component E (peptide arylation enzyme)